MTTGKKLLITAGPTREAIDPVRFLSNRSSGKMGYALAEAAVRAGYAVTLVSGPVALPRPDGLAEFVSVVSAAEMADAVKSRFSSADGAILCAAVADYRPVAVSPQKIKKQEGNWLLELERTEDILAALGRMKQPRQILAGFAAETEDLEANALAKLSRKNLDWIVANRVDRPDRGFLSDDNAATLFGAHGEVKEFPLMSKKALAKNLISAIFG